MKRSSYGNDEPVYTPEKKKALNQVFAALRKQNIPAKQDFLCCGSCASSSLYQEMNASPKKKQIRGYVFYHQQNTELLNDRGYTYLHFGAFKQGEDTTEAEDVAIGKLIVAELNKAGIETEWPETNAKCILFFLKPRAACVEDLAKRRGVPAAEISFF